MKKFESITILRTIKDLIGNTEADLKKQLEAIAFEWKVDEAQITHIYELMASFYEEIKNLGGEEKYKISDISWLKVELELLFESYQLCIENGMNIIDISQQLSNEHTGIFPKTPSQLQNTYYKVKKDNLPFENIMKHKPGRKKKTDEGFIPKSEKIKMAQQSAKITEQAGTKVTNYALDSSSEHHEKNFIKLLSGMINNFQAIYQNQENGDDSMYRLMEGIYTLSSIAAQKNEMTQRYEHVELEIDLLRHQIEELKKEKEEVIHDFRSLTDCVQDFVDSPEMTQIKTLPQFIDDCKEKLDVLGLAMNGEKNVKLFVDGSGQLISLPN